jgi:hypothetical protein
MRKGSYKRKAARKGKGRKAGTKIRGFPQMRKIQKWQGVAWPQSLLKKFIFHDSIPLTSSISVGIDQSTYYAYRLNSPYDPDYQIGGVTAQFFSTLCNATLYQKYIVLGCKVKISWTSGTGNPARAFMYLCGIEDFSTFYNPFTNDQLDLHSTSGIATKPIQLGNLYNSKNVSRTFYVPMHEVLGMSKKAYIEGGEQGGHVSGNSDGHFGYYNGNPGGSGGPGTVFLITQLIGDGEDVTVYIRQTIDLTFYTMLADNQDPGPGTKAFAVKMGKDGAMPVAKAMNLMDLEKKLAHLTEKVEEMSVGDESQTHSQSTQPPSQESKPVQSRLRCPRMK